MGSLALAVLVTTPAGLTNTKRDIMTKLLLVMLLVQCCIGARRLRGNAGISYKAPRDERSLLGTFPFSQQEAAHEDHDHHGNHGEHGGHSTRQEPSQAIESGSFRQADDDVDISFGALAEAGKKCVDKVEMVEETEYDDVIQCDH